MMSSPSTPAAAREHPVVQAEQAHHPVRHGPHRHHGADGQRSGAEVGPGGSAARAARAAAHGRRATPASATRPRPSAVRATRPARVRSCATLPFVGRPARWSGSSTPIISASSHSSSGLLAGQGVQRHLQPGRPARRAGRPGRRPNCRRRPAAARAPSQFWSCSLIADPEQHPIEPGPPGVLREALQVEPGAAVRASSPQRTPESATQAEIAPGRRRRSRTGGAPGGQAGEVEHLRGGDPAVGQVQQPATGGQQRVGLGQRAIGQPDPQAVRRVAVVDDVGEPEGALRSAARRPRCPGTSPGRRGAPGSVSAASSPTSTSRSTSTCRVGPWQACTWTLSSSSATTCVADPTGRWPIVAQVALQPGQQGARRPVRRVVVVDGAAADRVSCSSLASRPSEDSNGCAGAAARRILSADGSASPAATRRVVPTVAVTGGSATGGRRGAWPSAVSTRELADRQPGQPEQRQSLRQSNFRWSFAQGGERVGHPQHRIRSVDAVPQPAPQLALPAQVGRQVRAEPSSSRPCAQAAAWPAGGWRIRRTGRRAVAPPRTGDRGGTAVRRTSMPCPRWADSVRHQSWPIDSSITSSRRPHQAVR